LTEEDFDVKIITLDGGLDPDRFVREHGVQAYAAAIRDAKRQSDYLIDRARQQFPARSADAKVKALNFLLPHIRRIPNRIHRDEFAADAAQKLGIDSALMRQELKQAAAQRLESVPQHRQEPISETERVLLRALVLPETDPARRLAAEQLSQHPEWFSDLAMADVLESLSQGPPPANPLDAATTNESRAQLAAALQDAPEATSRSATQQVEDALHSLERRRLERRQRELRAQIAEADRRGDQAMLTTLTTEKLAIDRQLRDH
jgi:DNA primase